MKKSLIGLASLHAAATLAAAPTRIVNAFAISTGEAPQQPKLGENDDALTVKPLEPIITIEMMAGTQPMLKTGKTIKRRDLNPVSLADRKIRDVRPIHIGVGDKQWPDVGGSDMGGGSSDIPKPSAKVAGGITKMRSAQHGQQQLAALA